MNSILSTKKLTPSQRGLISQLGVRFVEYDAIKITAVNFKVPNNIENAIFTSQNALRSFFNEKNLKKQTFNCYCVGLKTKQLLEENGQKVIKMANNASELANYIANSCENEVFYHFCGNLRREEISLALNKAKIELFEVKTYETILISKKFDEKWDKILFFSPSGVESFTSENNIGNSLAICIGETTASEAQKHTDNIIISRETTIESVLKEIIKRH